MQRPAAVGLRRRMLQSSCACITLVVLLTTYLCRAADNEDFADFKINSLGETAWLNCNSTDSVQAREIPEFYEPIGWMLPNLSIVTTDDGDKYGLRENNWTLVVNDTVIEDLGVYHCMMLNSNINQTGGGYYLVKVGLNAEGPYFFDMWDRYMWPTIIGICCFFGFLLLAGVAIAIYHFRYISPEQEEDEKGGEEDKSVSEREAVALKADEVDAVKVGALKDDDDGPTTNSLPPYNGNANHTYENPSFEGENPYEAESESDDEGLTSL